MTQRFWTTAAAGETGDAAAILLDGKPLRLPSGAVLRPMTPALAEAIAAEWQAAPAQFGPAAVRLTGLAGSAQERVGPHQAAIAAQLARYAAADALCYRAPHPRDLTAAQHAAWQKWLDWAEATFGATLHTTEGLVQIVQPATSLERLHQALAGLTVAPLTALAAAIPLLGSCVLGLALAHQAIGAEEAFETALLDELFQEARWGRDEDAAARRAGMQADLEAACRFMELCRA